jgi:antitoxin (DNA-binding transcriptional repressor) of toxin-antitoxin stability system
MEATKVGMREFREQLARYLESEVPIAVTKHGRTVGLYIPVRHEPAEQDIAALRDAGRRLDEWLRGQGVTEEELVAEFKARRKQGPRKRGG